VIRRALSLAASASEAVIAALPSAPPELAQSHVLGDDENRSWAEPH
jgi:hypothetical protein